MASLNALGLNRAAHLKEHVAQHNRTAPHAPCLGRRGSRAAAAGELSIVSPADGSGPSTSYQTRVEGCLVGMMCGNVLAAPHENERAYRLIRMFPQGLTSFWKYDVENKPEPYGHYTGDFAAALAVAKSLTAAGRADMYSIADHLVAAYDPQKRRYNRYADIIYDALRSGANLFTLPDQAEQYMDFAFSRHAATASDRPDRAPFGHADHGAATRCLPLGLAYRHATTEVLAAAVEAGAGFSHPHPVGRDGALVVAAAVAWCSRAAAADDPECVPAALLERLLEVAETEDMRAKLALIGRQLLKVERVANWREFWQSREWFELTRVHNWVTYHNNATLGTEAAAAALWAMCCHWEQPAQAVSIAASFGGQGPAVAGITGALAGALHGTAWIPEPWWDDLENGPDGRDDVLAVAQRLAALDCHEVADLVPPGAAQSPSVQLVPLPLEVVTVTRAAGDRELVPTS